MSSMEKMNNTSDGINDGEFTTVQAIVLTAHGSLENVQVTNWPIPSKCQNKEIRVAVEYCGINFADVYHIQGRLLQHPVPYVLGLECAGVITEVGPQVNDFHVGERVVCYKPDGGLFKKVVVVDQDYCFPIPEDVTCETACTLIANYLTAYFALFELGNLKSGQTVLIHSAAGGVGWAATQLAATVKNVTIFGTSSASKHEEISRNGVTVPLIYDNYMSAITSPSMDLIIDNIGGENVKKSVSLLNHLGRVILTGANCVVQEDESQVVEALKSMGSSVVPLQDVVMGNKSVCGLHLGTLLQARPDTVREAVKHIFHLCQSGVIQPRIHAVFNFQQATEGIRSLTKRENIGKVLLRVE